MCIFFIFESTVDVANEMVVVVVADDQLFKFAIPAHLTPYVLVEGVEVVLHLAGVHLVLGVVGRVLVHVRHENGLRVRRLDMLSRAAVTVSACADFVVERAIDLILLGTEDGCKVVGHGYWQALMLAEEDLRESEEERRVADAEEADRKERRAKLL